MSREILLSLASEAARDPSRAAPIARYMAELLKEAENSEGQIPLGYLYAGAHKFLAIAEDVAVEPLLEPGSAPITNTRNLPIEIRIPFDVLIIGVAGWAMLDWTQRDSVAAVVNAAGTSQAVDFRDFFAVDWELDGRVSFTTDGRQRLMTPAAVSVGTQLRPRALAWTLRRNQVISVRFRNLINAFTGVDVDNPNLRRVSLAFYALNLEAP